MPHRLRRLTRVVIAAVIISLLATVVAGLEPGFATAQGTRSATWDRYDVTIKVERDGALLITERVDVAFSGSPGFTYGFAEIPTARIDRIDVIAIAEVTAGSAVEFEKVSPTEFSRQPATYSVEPRSDSIYLEYAFAPAVDETRTFVTTYRAHGALRVYGKGAARTEQIWWNAIDSEVTAVAPVRSASVTIMLPEPVAADQVVLGEDTKGPAGQHTNDGQVWRWEKTNLAEGDSFIARMQFPAVTTATAPSWQEMDDCNRARDERTLFRTLVENLLSLFGIPVDAPCRP